MITLSRIGSRVRLSNDFSVGLLESPRGGSDKGTDEKTKELVGDLTKERILLKPTRRATGIGHTKKAEQDFCDQAEGILLKVHD